MCRRVAAGVDKCEQRDRCRIISKGFRFEPSGDVIPNEPRDGALIIMDEPKTNAPLPGDAAPKTPVTGGHDPEYIAAGGFLTRPEATSEELHAPPLAQFQPHADATIYGTRPPITSPDGNPKTAVGITKPPLHAIPPLALLHLGQAMADGNRKYGLVNWRHDPITTSTYYNALMRHVLAWWDGQDDDPKTGIKHLAYIMANCAILLDAAAQGTLTDDRPSIKGKTAELIEMMTNQKEIKA